MNWISHWKKIGVKVKQILKKQPVGQQETDWKNCPQCKKISYITDLIEILKRKKRRVGVFPIDEDSWVDIGQWEEYRNAVKRFN